MRKLLTDKILLRLNIHVVCLLLCTQNSSIYNTTPYDEQIRINQYERGDKKDDEATAH